MRAAELPAGSLTNCTEYNSEYAGIYRVKATAPREYKIPFYYKDLDGNATFTHKDIGETFLTNIEIDQLIKEGFKVKVYEGFYWNDTFNMKELVDKLEKLRKTDPKGALGTVVKALGNNAYGKTVEKLDGFEYVIAKECPEGYRELDDDLTPEHIFFKISEDDLIKDYHCPQLGAFITAYVRMMLRQSILMNEKDWVYADTDCIAFKSNMNDKLDIDNSTYGAWKIEAEGEEYMFIDKKVYCDIEANEKHAKGMNLSKMTKEDFENWYNGRPPTQKQIQRKGFMRVIKGENMFHEREKIGSKKFIQKSEEKIKKVVAK